MMIGDWKINWSCFSKFYKKMRIDNVLWDLGYTSSELWEEGFQTFLLLWKRRDELLKEVGEWVELVYPYLLEN